jgi:hypothetical protein
LKTDFRYDRQNGDIVVSVNPETTAETAIFAALRERKIQPTLIEPVPGSYYDDGVKFSLKLVPLPTRKLSK